MSAYGAVAGSTADALTASRLALAPVLGLTVALGEYNAGAVLLSWAWLSDALDGRVARLTERHTRLGRWDLVVDTTVGASLVAGLATAGAVPLVLTVAAGLLAVGFIVLRNAALSMAVQAIGYGLFLLLAWRDAASLRWLPILTAALIAVADWHRLIHDVLPAFFHGIGSVLRLERHAGFDLGAGRRDGRAC